jgi:hypothetical protein
MSDVHLSCHMWKRSDVLSLLPLSLCTLPHLHVLTLMYIPMHSLFFFLLYILLPFSLTESLLFVGGAPIFRMNGKQDRIMKRSFKLPPMYCPGRIRSHDPAETIPLDQGKPVVCVPWKITFKAQDQQSKLYFLCRHEIKVNISKLVNLHMHICVHIIIIF